MADIASSGTADSFVHEPATKTRHAHQVTATGLCILLQQAYVEDCTPDDANNKLIVNLLRSGAHSEQVPVFSFTAD